jgi:hypothetical protein
MGNTMMRRARFVRRASFPFAVSTCCIWSVADGIFKAAYAAPLWTCIEADMIAFSLVNSLGWRCVHDPN